MPARHRSPADGRGPGGGDIEQVALGVIDLFEIGFVSNVLDTLKNRHPPRPMACLTVTRPRTFGVGGSGVWPACPPPRGRRGCDGAIPRPALRSGPAAPIRRGTP